MEKTVLAIFCHHVANATTTSVEAILKDLRTNWGQPQKEDQTAISWIDFWVSTEKTGMVLFYLNKQTKTHKNEHSFLQTQCLCNERLRCHLLFCKVYFILLKRKRNQGMPVFSFWRHLWMQNVLKVFEFSKCVYICGRYDKRNWKIFEVLKKS